MSLFGASRTKTRNRNVDDDIDVTHNVRRFVRQRLFRIEKDRVRPAD